MIKRCTTSNLSWVLNFRMSFYESHPRLIIIKSFSYHSIFHLINDYKAIWEHRWKSFNSYILDYYLIWFELGVKMNECLFLLYIFWKILLTNSNETYVRKVHTLNQKKQQQQHKKLVTRGVTKEIHVAKNNRETRETCCRLYCITNYSTILSISSNRKNMICFCYYSLYNPFFDFDTFFIFKN